MNTHDKHRVERYVRRVEELHTWRNARERPVKEWRFTAGESKSYHLNLGDFWPVIELPVRLTASTTIPEEWAGQPVELELWLGGEGFVRLSTGTEGGLNPFHRSFRISDRARGGEKIEIEAEVVSKGLFGSHIVEPRLERACLVVPETEVRALERDLGLIVEACAYLDDHGVVPHLLDVLDEAFCALAADWPSESDVALTRLLQAYVNPMGAGLWSLPDVFAKKAVEVNRVGRELWSLPPAPGPLEPLPEEARQAARQARELIAAHLEKIKRNHPPVGRLALTGHAHIDLAWLWPLDETRRKARRTFASVLGLMQRYEDFTFNQSSAQLYEWIEEDAPQLFARIKKRVVDGRWEPVGGSWTEPDCQITGGESFVRQLLYGQRYFESKFGARSTVAWFPDVFGFSPAIPQLLLGAGMKYFFTCKLAWNETNRFPLDLFEWEGIDGSRVTAHMFHNPGMDYNGDIVPFDLLGTWRNFKGKRLHSESLFSFGWGDGGGGPSEKMLENYARLRDFPALPHLRMTRVDEFFATLPKVGLPKWVGELYLELHRGTFTSQGKIKQLNRAAEHRLLEAEAFAAIATLHGHPEPRKALETAWKTLLLNQFHDILPGSSIAEVHEEAHRQLVEVVETVSDIRDAALRHLARLVEVPANTERVALVANAALTPRPLTVLLRGFDGTASVADTNGKPLPAQKTEEGLLIHDPDRQVPALGWMSFLISRGGHAPEAAPLVYAENTGERVVLENDLLRAVIGTGGDLEEVFDKIADRDVLDGRGNQLWWYVDKPRQWDAWDIDEDYELAGGEIGGVDAIETIETGPLRATVRVRRTWRASLITQTYRLLARSRRLDIETHVDWQERQVLLKARFPLAVRSHEATYETMYGVVRRPTHRNTSWDAARFEVSAHRFADLSETGYGVALLNDGKYGHSARDNVLEISLLRSPVYPAPLADRGEHHFAYSLFPHPENWTEASVVEEAFELNSPLCPVTVEPGTANTLGGEFTLATASGVPLALGSLKNAEDGRGLILRLYEPYGARGGCVLHFASEVKQAERANLLEDTRSNVAAPRVEGNTVGFEVCPFEVVTLRVEL